MAHIRYMKHRRAAHPNKPPQPRVKLDKAALPKVSAALAMQDIHEADAIAFDESEHRVIRFACAALRETLESVMYKLSAMDVMRDKK